MSKEYLGEHGVPGWARSTWVSTEYLGKHRVPCNEEGEENSQNRRAVVLRSRSTRMLDIALEPRCIVGQVSAIRSQPHKMRRGQESRNNIWIHAVPALSI